MAKTSASTFRFEVSADQLLEVLTDPEFQVHRTKIVQDALDVTVKGHTRDKARCHYEVHAKEYAKGLKGIDRSRTEVTVSTYDWDLAAKRGDWTYKCEHDKVVKTWGSLRIEPAGKASTLKADFFVESKVPLLGGQIEKGVVAEVDKSWAKYERAVRSWLEKKA